MRQFSFLLGIGLCTGPAMAAQVAPIILPPVKSAVFDLTRTDDLWFFNGPTPTNYKTTVQINAAGPSAGTFSWQVTTNQKAVALNGRGSSASSTGNAPLNVTSSEISLSSGDVTVHFQYNGNDVGDFPLTVFAPLQKYTTLAKIVYLTGPTDKTPSGFDTYADYRIRNQFQDMLPRPLDLNEFFDLATIVNMEPNVGWTTLSANGGITSTDPSFPNDPPAYFQDRYGRNGVLIPLPQSPPAPPAPLSTEEVFNVTQKYFMGSQSPGVGRQASVSTLHMYRDHAFPEMKN